jgi:hypothetical protein
MCTQYYIVEYDSFPHKTKKNTEIVCISVYFTCPSVVLLNRISLCSQANRTYSLSKSRFLICNKIFNNISDD